MLKVDICYEPGKKNVLVDALSRIKREDKKSLVRARIISILDQEIFAFKVAHYKIILEKIFQ
ncbi:hypothetical protein BCR32DRAFT_284190 [Anaeromyces robustus]|uniref:Uncharacterized protein n=1 Tax=Anaeromyces robustus TaxID=1754192 RepID=A0A1Y1WSB0_9FUNG|nr:hypothetical protein BCR32DRAFT_284190 [Anaeromyces robustus]|eukprot:ORX76423.1 hypothetical protein BCR32DRAFT_284190 [Anaeromyces robustus]